MSLDPLLTLALMLALWAAGIGYIYRMAAREARGQRKSTPRPEARNGSLS